MIFIRRVRRHSTVCTVSKTAQYSLYCKQVTSGKEQHPQKKKEIQHHLWQCNCISIVASGTNWDATYSSPICMRINPWTNMLPMWHNATTGNQKHTTYQIQPMENSSTNGKDATPSNMETQNAKKWRMQWKANAWHLHNKTSIIEKECTKQIKLALENIWKMKKMKQTKSSPSAMPPYALAAGGHWCTILGCGCSSCLNCTHKDRGPSIADSCSWVRMFRR